MAVLLDAEKMSNIVETWLKVCHHLMVRELTGQNIKKKNSDEQVNWEKSWICSFEYEARLFNKNLIFFDSSPKVIIQEV